jgi:hypothetical protein
VIYKFWKNQKHSSVADERDFLDQLVVIMHHVQVIRERAQTGSMRRCLAQNHQIEDAVIVVYEPVDLSLQRRNHIFAKGLVDLHRQDGFAFCDYDGLHKKFTLCT